MISVNFRVQDYVNKDIPLFPEFKAELDPDDGTIVGIGLLERGMESGKPSIGFMIRHQDKIIHVETSAAMFLTLAAGIKGTMERWGEPWDGA